MTQLAVSVVQVRVLDGKPFRDFVERVQDFIGEYAWHTRECAAIDIDGQWRLDSPACNCGYEDALAALSQEVEVEP